uniref:Uncharacterized protein n=1 Tax=Magallana gigas TaxID=29159 RepID=K1PHJ2_MAGGI
MTLADHENIGKRSTDNRKPILPVNDYTDPCGQRPCLHSGICEWTPRSHPPFICHCPVGYKGNICEMKSDGIKPEGGDIIPKKTHLAFDDVIKLVDGPSASRMLVVFGATILGIVLIIIIHCCRVLSRKQKEDADYLKRLQTKDNLPKSLPPGCCELSNSVFFETLCCLGVIKDNIKKERNEINVDQLVSELKLAKSLSMTMSKNASKLVSDGKRSKHSLRPSRSRRPSEQRISMQQRSQLDFKPSTNGGKKDDSYVINVEGNETFADRTKLDGDQAESPMDSLRSLPLLKEAIRQSNNHVKCSCGKIIASESKNKRPSSEGFKAQQQLHPSASSRISFTDGSLKDKVDTALNNKMAVNCDWKHLCNVFRKWLPGTSQIIVVLASPYMDTVHRYLPLGEEATIQTFQKVERFLLKRRPPRHFYRPLSRYRLLGNRHYHRNRQLHNPD